ncbi:MAG: hypothetical protein PWR03_1884 [Tenuifilum sp.]|jgi:quercetin dioxygenase-like cupin family protein|uniref:cupin domain-containing protein n=1 Tax=Tenuifilum sp. TaxID=2760880 RepID=UPI0024AC3A23|nr:cupin domain-containing protein [Tenuifilum sp.]MDI3527701.1 hypothetical protein [Tenuifilum sp.]
MLKLTNLSDAPRVPFDLDGRIMFSSQKVEMVHLNLKPGEKIPMHSNPFEVVFYLLEGELELTVNNDAVALKPDSTVHVGIDENRSLENKADKIARVLVIKVF